MKRIEIRIQQKWRLFSSRNRFIGASYKATGQIRDISEELSLADDMGKDIRLFIDEIGQYAAITELDEVIAHRLIHKIVMSEKQVVDGEKIQRVRIVYNFAGELGE